ncbi:Txe/YoeB family addiction module toxin [Skermanella mucosa]|uniref:Txe/YoeB family addiction module toxin n=1 Tax=Skermanella mucosa TaxID=1789672 RepID=UPI00192CB9BA|nr:Txe/YoeB family addiction module toxin [Skermanella mucosa]UEM20624.1 Txe/YoeB family addiction module toxin [Skermanella mucosa]
MTRLAWTDAAWEDYTWWQENDRKTARRINELIKSALRTPFDGVGKPEPLKGDWAGWWSRRITLEHRLVYQISRINGDETLIIAQCRYHY